MIGFIIKNWKLVIDVLLVIGLILAFTFVDPFDIFQHSKLKQTANLVTSVRDIGQLVTAEYYGEVISSWKEFTLNEYPQDSITRQGEGFFIWLKEKLWRNDFSEINDEAIPAQYQEVSDKFMAFLGIHFFPDKSVSKFYNENSRDSRRNRKIQKQLWEEGDRLRTRNKHLSAVDRSEIGQRYLDSIPSYLDGFYDFYRSLENKDLTKGELKKKNIVFIGRGWVKAGFDFGTFDESNFLYEKDAKTVHFYGLKAVILDQDINPWFIPQQKVKGFELVDFSGDVDFTDAKEVKADCKRKLGEQAGAELLRQAQENGKDALKNFFSLLLDEPDLIIAFHTSPYDHLFELVSADSLVTLREASVIDSTYRKDIVRIRRMSSPDQKQKGFQLLVGFIDRLKKLQFLKKQYAFNYFSLSAASILRDSFHLHPADFELLKNLRGEMMASADKKNLITQTTRKDSCWFVSGDFEKEFNATIDLLSKEVIAAPELPFLKARADSLESLRELRVDSSVTSVLKFNPVLFSDLMYDTSYLTIRMDTLSLSDTTYLDSRVIAVQNKIVMNPELMARAKRERTAIQIVLKNKLEIGFISRFRKTLLKVGSKLSSR